MKIQSLGWIDMSCAVSARRAPEHEPAQACPPAAVVASEVRGTSDDARSAGPGAVEHYLTQEGTVIRLENAELCSPLDHANLFE
jgi:hypothetical protein